MFETFNVDLPTVLYIRQLKETEQKSVKEAKSVEQKATIVSTYHQKYDAIMHDFLEFASLKSDSVTIIKALEILENDMSHEEQLALLTVQNIYQRRQALANDVLDDELLEDMIEQSELELMQRLNRLLEEV